MNKPILEVWRNVVGYEGRYIVSNLGRIKSLPNSRRKSQLIMKLTRKAGTRLLVVALTSNVEGKWVQSVKYVHQIVLEAFEGERPSGAKGRHRDGDSRNNYATNLFWEIRLEITDEIQAHNSERDWGYAA